MKTEHTSIENLLDSIDLNTHGIKGADLQKVVELSEKLKKDQTYNIVPEIPANVYKLIQDEVGKDAHPELVADAAKLIITQIADSKEFIDERNKLKKELKDMAKAASKDIDEFMVTQREIMGNRISKAIEETTDAKKKQTLTDISVAFQNAYSFKPLYEVIKMKEYRKALKNDKYWKRFVIDFEYHTKKFGSFNLDEIRKAMEECKIASFEKEELDHLFIALAVYAHKAKISKAESWFMYNTAKNLLGIAYATTINSDLEERAKNLEKFFKAAA